MAPNPSGPPGLPRPEKPSPPSRSPCLFSPAPSKPHTSWFQLLASPSPSPIPFATPAAALSSSAEPPAHLTDVMGCLPSTQLYNNHLITDLSPAESLAPTANDPWTRAHVRVCTHASEDCAACSISVVCCSCRSLRVTPGPPPASPKPAIHRSRSASPALFRDLGNHPPPTGFDSCPDNHDDEAYARALAECDTCDNSSCPRGHNEPASWTIIVEQFDDSLEEFYDRPFCACAACNRSCKKTFMSYKIKSRQFDNSSKMALTSRPVHVLNPTLVAPNEVSPPLATAITPINASTVSRPTTPLQVFSAVTRTHRMSCSHTFSTCPVCSRGITCCECNNIHTAPARLKLCCACCLHHACATCTTPFCCSCHKPWFPTDSPALVLANRFRGGARSTKSSKKGSSSSSQSSGPGSLASARSQQHSPDPFNTAAPTSGLLPTQSSVDEIDAFTERTIRVSNAAVPQNTNAPERSTRAPSPSSNLPSGPPLVFSRPPLPTVVGATEDVATAVPSRAPSRAASIRTSSSIGDDGIANEPQPPPFPTPVPPPAFNDVIGRIHRRFPLASLKVDEEDSRHFIARDNTRVDDIANETDYLLSSHTSWPSILYFIRDTMKFESIQGPLTDFQVVLSGLAEIWSDAASFDARELLRDMLDASRLLPKAEKEIDRLESVSARYRNKRNAARTQLKTTETELSRLRQAANDTLDSNARLLTEIDQLRASPL